MSLLLPLPKQDLQFFQCVQRQSSPQRKEEQFVVERKTCGGKAANLALLSSLSFPVPEGFVIPHTSFVSLSSSSSSSSSPKLEKITGELRQQITDAISRLWYHPENHNHDQHQSQHRNKERGVLLAIRSSSMEEDTNKLSFAGQFKTILSIDSSNIDLVCDSIVQVWNSSTQLSPLLYKAFFREREREEGREGLKNGGEGEGREEGDKESFQVWEQKKEEKDLRKERLNDVLQGMGVIVERMVEAKYSGVCFTLDPLSSSLPSSSSFPSPSPSPSSLPHPLRKQKWLSKS